MKSNRVSVYEGDTAGNSESFLKGQHTKFCLQPLTLGSSRERAEWTRDAWGESGVGVSGERSNGTADRSLCWVISHTAEAIFLRQSTPLQVASAWGEAGAPHKGIILPYFVELNQGCWLQLEAISLISLTTKAWNTQKQPKWEDKEADPKWKNKRILQKKT